MKEKKFNTPILFIIFNRPDTTDIVFAEIKKIRPKKLFIAADGPRKNVPEDYKKCAKTRELIKKNRLVLRCKNSFSERKLGLRLWSVHCHKLVF